MNRHDEESLKTLTATMRKVLPTSDLALKAIGDILDRANYSGCDSVHTVVQALRGEESSKVAHDSHA